MKKIAALFIFFLFQNTFVYASDLECYLKTDFLSVSVGIGYFKGNGVIFCDNGASVKAAMSGWNVLGAGISRSKFDEDMYMAFTGMDKIEDIEDGRYHGGGFQLSIPMVLSVDLAAYTNGNATLKWVKAPFGIGIALPYKTIEIRFRGDVQPPSKKYKTLLKILGNLEITYEDHQFQEGKNRIIGFRVKHEDLPKDESIILSHMLEADGLIWNSEIRFASKRISQTEAQPHYIIENASKIEAGKKYHFTIAYLDELVPIVYKYTFTMPDNVQDLKVGSVIPSTVQRIKTLNPFK